MSFQLFAWLRWLHKQTTSSCQLELPPGWSFDSGFHQQCPQKPKHTLEIRWNTAGEACASWCLEQLDWRLSWRSFIQYIYCIYELSHWVWLLTVKLGGSVCIMFLLKSLQFQPWFNGSHSRGRSGVEFVVVPALWVCFQCLKAQPQTHSVPLHSVLVSGNLEKPKLLDSSVKVKDPWIFIVILWLLSPYCGTFLQPTSIPKCFLPVRNR